VATFCESLPSSSNAPNATSIISSVSLSSNIACSWWIDATKTWNCFRRMSSFRSNCSRDSCNVCNVTTYMRSEVLTVVVPRIQVFCHVSWTDGWVDPDSPTDHTVSPTSHSLTRLLCDSPKFQELLTQLMHHTAATHLNVCYHRKLHNGDLLTAVSDKLHGMEGHTACICTKMCLIKFSFGKSKKRIIWNWSLVKALVLKMIQLTYTGCPG
jgi:hypothetical protein